MKVFIWINSMVFMLYGIGFIFFPESLSQFVTDGQPTSRSGLIDMRATYGGMSVGFALLLGYLTQKNQDLKLGVLAITLIMSGMAIGRLIGIFQDGSPNKIMYIYLILEIVVAVIGVSLLKKNNNL